MIHNVAVAGHGTCGKTTLVEELLARAKSIPRAGKVDDGSSILDYDPEERERHYTIDATPCYIKRGEETLQLVDTPGYPDFLGATVDAFMAVETALIAVDSVAGLRVNTRRVWDEAKRAHLARMFVITRLDLENAKYEEWVDEIQENFGTRCLPVVLPNGVGKNFTEVESTFHLTEESSDRAREIHGQIIDAVVEADESLMERYLAEEPISPDEIAKAFAFAMIQGTMVPILCCSTTAGVGLEKLVDLLLNLAPAHDAALGRQLVNRAGEPVEGRAAGDENSPFLARCFKVESDAFVGKLSYFRVLAGKAEPNMAVENVTRHIKERLPGLMRIQGKEHEPVDAVTPGMIFAVPKLDSLQIGDSIGAPGRESCLAPIRLPQSMVKLALEPKNRGDETKIGEALNKLAETDHTFTVTRVKSTRELVVAGRSNLHLDVMLSRLARRFELEVNTHVPKTSYMESIQGNAEGHHKHKKQSGGRGQFGEVYLRVEPAEKGAGLEMVNALVGGSIPTQFVPAIEKGVRETMDDGILAHCPVVDCKVTVYDGSFHNVDSSEAAFKIAGREAFKKAFMAAKPCLLEPIVDIEIHFPVQHMGDITGDLNSRRGRIGGMDTVREMQIIRATVPEAEIKSYSTELRSLTGGEASYTVEFSHYEPVPGNVAQQVIKEVAAAAEH